MNLLRHLLRQMVGTRKNMAINGKRKTSHPMILINNWLKLHTLQSSDGPTLEECNRILDEMQLFDMSDPLYIVACSIFCESKAHREQWMLLHQKPEVVRRSWIELNGKKLGLL